MRLLWLTDIHLDALEQMLGQMGENQSIEDYRLWRDVLAEEPDAVLIGGDISTARRLQDDLRIIEQILKCPIYFVLGNHDFYWGEVANVRLNVEALCQNIPHLHYLSRLSAIELAPSVALIGHDGWGDGRIGSYVDAVRLLDDTLIHDLAYLAKSQLFAKLQAYGDDAAYHIRRVLTEALTRYTSIYLLTHIPPFKEACWHMGGISDDNYLPRFTCGAVGDVLWEIMSTHPNHHLTVLCGHTHSAGEVHILNNLHVITGGNEYGDPKIQRVFDV